MWQKKNWHVWLSCTWFHLGTKRQYPKLFFHCLFSKMAISVKQVWLRSRNFVTIITWHHTHSLLEFKQSQPWPTSSEAPWVRKYGNLCFREILVLRKSSVRRVRPYICPPLHVSVWEMTHFNTICVKLGIGHPCCYQLTAVKKGYPLSGVTWLHCGLRYTTHGGDVMF